MRRRRKQGNPLLFKIVGYVVLAHVIALPILARLGVLQKAQHYVDVQMDLTPPPPAPKEKIDPKKAVHKAAQKVARRGPSPSHASSRSPANNGSHLAQPKLMGGGPEGGGGNGEPGVDLNGSGKAGALPTTLPTPAPAPAATPAAPAAVPTPAPPTRPAPTPAATPTPAPPPPLAPTGPAVVYQPAPSLPDSVLAGLTGPVDATAIVLVQVDTSGKASQPKIIQSSGTPDLDNAALDIARQYRFKPATRGGQPIDSEARVHIEFQVN